MLYGFKSYMDLKAINSEIGLENEGDMDLQGAKDFLPQGNVFYLGWSSEF